jgi:hypothetical protein
MSRGNMALAIALVVAMGLWLVSRSRDNEKTTPPTPRLFPEFNREGADRIEISGGVTGTSWAIARSGSSPWQLVSAGDYPVKREEVDRFLDAVASLRKDNPVGTSADMQAQTQTDDKNGRLVRVLKDEQPIAEFYVGKQPKRAYEEFFIRKAGDNTVFRTTTILSKDRDLAALNPEGQHASGFSWDAYVNEESRKWVDPEIWDLGNAEVEELMLKRKDLFEATIKKEAQDKWDLTEGGNAAVPADADVASGILSVVRRLSLYEVVGAYDDVVHDDGLDDPEITLHLKLRRKKPPPPPKEGEEKKAGEEKKEEPKEEWETLDRVVEVGKKVSRKHWDNYSDEVKTDDYYAVHVGPKADVGDKAGYVFLIRAYTAGELRKELAELRAKPKEEKKGPEEGEKEGAKPGEKKAEETPAEKKPEGEKKAEETKPAETKPAETKPADGKKPAEETKPADEKKPEEPEKPKDGCGEQPKDEGCGCGG